MPEPISASNSSPSQLSSDPRLDQTAQVCRGDAPNSSQPDPVSCEPPAPPAAVAKLVSAVSTSAPALPAASAPPLLSQAENNAQRTTERHGSSRYADAGVSHGA